MLHAAAGDGYAGATVARVIAHAGVSRPTFYEYFTDKDDCFLAALQAIQDQLEPMVRSAVLGEPPERAVDGAVAALVQFADRVPAIARVLLDQATGGGARALDVRDRGIDALARLIEQRYEAAPARSAVVPDLAPRTVIGGIFRLLASRLRTRRPCNAELLEDLLAWTDSYATPLHARRWTAMHPVAPIAPSHVLESPLHAPPALGPGHARLSRREIDENHRRRILLAAARLAEHKGFTATTIADITSTAGVDNRVFYRVFHDKQAAFLALHELLFRHIMAVTAAGFLAGASWPERIWEAGRAFAQYIEQNPTLAHASFVDSHAGGAEVLLRVEQLVGGFTIFLQEGFRHEPSSRSPSPVALQAIATTVFELDYAEVRARRVGQLSGLLPHASFISLAPFLGAAGANQFIDGKLAARRAPRASPGRRR